MILRYLKLRHSIEYQRKPRSNVAVPKVVQFVPGTQRHCFPFLIGRRRKRKNRNRALSFPVIFFRKRENVSNSADSKREIKHVEMKSCWFPCGHSIVIIICTILKPRIVSYVSVKTRACVQTKYTFHTQK
jgi:hypothetical protein